MPQALGKTDVIHVTVRQQSTARMSLGERPIARNSATRSFQRAG
jgi:hypothetical protein